jgi:hypothetical protein
MVLLACVAVVLPKAITLKYQPQRHTPELSQLELEQQCRPTSSQNDKRVLITSNCKHDFVLTTITQISHISQQISLL